MNNLTKENSKAGSIAVFGATGYIGSHLVRELVGHNYAVRCLVRPRSRSEDVRFLEACGAEVVGINLESNQPFPRAVLADVACVVHLIGSVAPTKRESFSHLHVALTDRLLNECCRAGVGKIVMVTSLGARQGAVSQYQTTKWQAEMLVSQGQMNYVILQPSLVIGRMFGRRDSKLVKRYCNLISQKAIVPLIGQGNNQIQPVFIGDLIQAIAVAVGSSAFDGQSLELGGAEVLTMKEFVTALMKILQVDKPLFALPISVSRLIASVCQSWQDAPTISIDQVRLATTDNICRDNALTRMIGRQPVSLAKALESYAMRNGDNLINN